VDRNLDRPEKENLLRGKRKRPTRMQRYAIGRKS
jgi:hypothetical protein